MRATHKPPLLEDNVIRVDMECAAEMTHVVGHGYQMRTVITENTRPTRNCGSLRTGSANRHSISMMILLTQHDECYLVLLTTQRELWTLPVYFQYACRVKHVSFDLPSMDQLRGVGD